MTEKLKRGDVVQLQEGHKVYARVPKHFVYENCRGDFSLTKTDVTIGGDFTHLAGLYVVVWTAKDGGGTAHGPHDTFPNGHHVFCERMDDRSVAVDFYQTGCFTAMIEDIQPIGHVEAGA